MDCGTLKRGSAYNCAAPLQGGAEPNVLLFNKSDIVAYTIGSIPNQITGFTLAAQSSGYVYSGFGRSVAPSIEVLKQNSGQNLSKHQVILYIFNRSQQTKNTVQDLILGTFTAVIEGTQKNADTFEVYGLNCGLQMAPGKIHELNTDNGAYVITLATPDGQGEAKLPQTFYDDTSYATTKAIVYGYAFLPTITSLNVYALAAAGGTAVTVTGTNFYGSIGANDVESVTFIKKNTEAETAQATYTVASATSITFNSVALTAGTYNLRVTTSKGSYTLKTNITVS